MHWYLTVLRKYAVFSGRARRREHFLFALVNVLVSVALNLIDRALGIADPVYGYGPLQGIYGLAVIAPFVAAAVRRLHDSNCSGMWVLIGLVPFLGGFVLLCFFILDSHPGPNAYGPNPKGMVA